MMNSCNGSGTGEAPFELQFLVPATPPVGALSIMDYSCYLEGVTVNRTGTGQYTVTFITNQNIDVSKLPEAYGNAILTTGTIPTTIGFTNFTTLYNANATNYFWTVTFTVLSAVGAALTDPIGEISIRLSWETKAACS